VKHSLFFFFSSCSICCVGAFVWRGVVSVVQSGVLGVVQLVGGFHYSVLLCGFRATFPSKLLCVGSARNVFLFDSAHTYQPGISRVRSTPPPPWPLPWLGSSFLSDNVAQVQSVVVQARSESRSTGGTGCGSVCVFMCSLSDVHAKNTRRERRHKNRWSRREPS
jgi:hypothetical protein